jgi:hypothetical protein
VIQREVGVAESFVTTIQQRAAEMEQAAAAMRKLVEAAQELGEERVRDLLAPMLNGNGDHNGHAIEEPLSLPIPTDDDGPRGREAIRLIVAERPGIWALVDLREEMKRRGWFASNKGVDVAVTRMSAKGEARRVGKGRYEFPATNQAGDSP